MAESFLDLLKKSSVLRNKLIGIFALLAAALFVLCVFSPAGGNDGDAPVEEALSSVAEGAEEEPLIPEGTGIGGLDVGGLSREEAEDKLLAACEAAGSPTLTVLLSGRTLTIETDFSSLNEDVSSAVERAISSGGDETEIPFEPAYTYDSREIEAQIEALAEEIYAEPVDTSWEVTVWPLVLTITRGKSGAALDADGLTEAVLNALEAGNFDDLSWEVETLPFEEAPLDELYELYTWAALDASYDRVSHSCTEERNGDEPDIPYEDALKLLEDTPEGESLTLSFHLVEPEITAADYEEMLFRDLLCAYTSPYTSDYNRTENLRLACEAINGTVILPGEIFSFNDTVGERTTAKGYRSAIAYISGDSVATTGGGICQVASTIYCCCLYTEMEIVQREPHMYTVTYVPGGMDATVYWGSIDFRFRNSSDYPLMINAWLEDGYCHIEFLGTDTLHHRVEMESIGLSSLKYQVYRYVYDENDALIKKEDIGVSAYSPHRS